MDIKQLLRSEVQEFIKTHESSDLSALVLQRDKYPDLPLREIVGQIKARKKARQKLPTWYNTANILYANPLSIEQASSEITAQWKAKYIGKGKSGVDLTGGFGVDSHYFAQNFDRWTHIEPNTALQEVVRHNANHLGNNIIFHNSNSEEFLNQLTHPVDFIYLDPDRRPAEHKVAGFTDSRPEITKLLPSLREAAPQILIKASPMIDIKAGLADLSSVQSVLVISINNEVKEVLFHLNYKNDQVLNFRCIDINKRKEIAFVYNSSEMIQEGIKISALGAFLFEPGAAILKARGQDILAKRYGLGKLHRNTNLFTAEKPITDYPGRVFKVVADLPYKKKVVAEYLVENKANLSTRNFIDSPEQMKKKLGVQDGGDVYVFGYRNFESKNRVAVSIKVEGDTK